MGKIIAFIPVRGGSKSIPMKNIKSFCGKPLIYWNLKALQESSAVTDIIVATDSSDIKKTAYSFGFSKVSVYDRDAENAQDQSSTESVMLEYINKRTLNVDDLFILVQATSPLTQTKDFNIAIKMYFDNKYDSLLTCVRFKRFFWNENGVPTNYDFRKRPRRQDFKGMLMENGAFYINTVGNIQKDQCRLSGNIGIYEMPEFTSVELDEENDWMVAERTMNKYVLVQISKKPLIKLLLTDVDGVLTDAGMYYSENGDELKKFNTRDGKGLELLRLNGIKTGIITTEKTKLVERRAQKLKVDYLVQGAVDKLTEAKNICSDLGITLDNVAFIGDDINDKELLQHVGMAACPKNADEEIRSLSGIIILDKKGGEGAVREFTSIVIKLKGNL